MIIKITILTIRKVIDKVTNMILYIVGHGAWGIAPTNVQPNLFIPGVISSHAAS